MKTIIHEISINDVPKLISVILLLNLNSIVIYPKKIIINHSKYIVEFHFAGSDIDNLKKKEMIAMSIAEINYNSYLQNKKYKNTYERICQTVIDVWRECFHKLHNYKITLKINEKLYNIIIDIESNSNNYTIICKELCVIFANCDCIINYNK
jgi:hypothetical protein